MKLFNWCCCTIGLVCAVMFSSCHSPAGDEHNRSKISIAKSEDLYLPADLEVTLWAESPLLHNPTNMDVDAKGRIWVTEAVNYRNYNNKDSAFLHRKTGDRIIILEDTDNDGVADSSKIFTEDADLVSPVGIAVIGNKIIVSCSPNLIVFTDENGDDVPDSKKILLTGFGGRDHDHSLHAVYAGADGNWYFNVGNAGPHVVTDTKGWTLRSGSMYTGGSPYNLENRGNMVSDDGNVWVGGLALRMDTTGGNLKVLGHNFRNSYEVIPDSYGNLWQNDNDDQVVSCRTTWLMEGGNAGFFSTDGTRSWQADQRPGQDVFAAHWHQEDPGVMPAGDCSGAGAPTGITIMEGDELGERYQGMVLSADAGRNIIFGYHPNLHHSGYDLGTKEYFLSSITDSNERYVWNDSALSRQREKWFRPSDVTVGTDGSLYVADWYDPVVGGHQMQDTAAYGRIYRITRKGTKMTPPTFDLNTTQGQIAALQNPAINVRNEGFTHLLKRGEESIPQVKHLLNHENPYVQARAIWLLSKLGEKGKKETAALLSHKNELVRATAYRALRQLPGDILSYATEMVNDASPFVRREVIVSLADQPYDKIKPMLLQLAKNFDVNDRWYLEAFGSVVDKNAPDMYLSLKEKMAAGKSPAEWDRRMSLLAWRLHPTGAIKDLTTRATATSLSEKERGEAITALAFIRNREAAQAMITLSKSGLEDVSLKSRYWLSFRQHNDWANFADWNSIGVNTAFERKMSAMKVKMQMLLDERQSDDERRWQAEAMAVDSIGGQLLIGLAEQKKIPSRLMKAIEAKIYDNPDATVRVQAGKYFSKKETVVDYSISDILSLQPNAANGKKVFDTKCASCHAFGTKQKKAAPELTFISQKLDDRSLLDAIIHPDAAIVFGYESWLVNTSDNESYFGFQVSDNAQTMVIRDLAGNDHPIRKEKIVQAQKQQKSIMPSAAQNKLSPQQLRDVAAYLRKGN